MHRDILIKSWDGRARIICKCAGFWFEIEKAFYIYLLACDFRKHTFDLLVVCGVVVMATNIDNPIFHFNFLGQQWVGALHTRIPRTIGPKEGKNRLWELFPIFELPAK